jgi:membrane-bound serine protease (ClpP class)
MWCHVLLFSPVWGLGLFLILPWPVALALYLAIVALSLFLYVKIMHSMHEPVLTGQEALLGRTAEVGLEGNLKIGGERWQIARPEGLVPGQRVRIVGLRGMRLQVQPIEHER